MNFSAVINAIVEHTGFLFSKYFFLFLYQVEDKGHANDFNIFWLRSYVYQCGFSFVFVSLCACVIFLSSPSN